jgi:competence protein ComGC
MKGILLLTTVLILSVLPAFAQKTGTIKNADKTELIRLILEDARIYKGYLFSNKDRPVLYFSSEKPG